MGESTYARTRLRFDRRLRLEFRGATITSDAGLLACRELDDALGLTETANECLQESRSGRNVQHQLSRVNHICQFSVNSFAGSPPRLGPVAGLHRCGSWGRQIPG